MAAHLFDSFNRRQLDSPIYFCNQSATFHVTGPLENSTVSLYENEKGRARAKSCSCENIQSQRPLERASSDPDAFPRPHFEKQHPRADSGCLESLPHILGSLLPSVLCCNSMVGVARPYEMLFFRSRVVTFTFPLWPRSLSHCRASEREIHSTFLL